MPEYFITAENNTGIFHDVQYKDGAQTYTIDFSPWAEENGSVTTATWTLKAGDAAISGESLTSSVATALVTFSNSGRNLIQIKGANGTETFIAHIDILVKDPQLNADDYGFCG